ncbi:MAG TPA: Hsp20/alpha crystallin family protein [Thermoanaerobaculia bacterium]|nr:Hsp20/alpha crystallin family protein [Thermoanaerobaculia bacterium]
MSGRYASLFFLSRFQAELDRLLQEAMEFSDGDATLLGDWQPAIDIVETGSSILILAEVPGFAAGDLRIEVRGPLVVLSGTKSTQLPADMVKCHCLERSHGRFGREIQLLWPVNSHRGAARLGDGLLTIEFPKIQDKRQRARHLPVSETADTAESGKIGNIGGSEETAASRAESEEARR